MSHFGGRLVVAQIGRGVWSLEQSLVYASDVYGAAIVVPREFVTDFASVPRVPFAYLLTGGRAPGPATVHDWLYQHPDWEDRELADRIFHEALGVQQPLLGFEAESPAVAGAMWAGVRAGGWYAWAQHRQRQSDLNPEWTARDTWPETT
ncbi:MAG TPA: DUF1353 domain-containing protein [Methylomirabilota bacterium]